MTKERKKYILTFMITLGIFLAVFILVDFLNFRKRESISELQNKITVDLIANETQFDLLKNTPCKAIEGSILSRQLGELGQKLAYAEETQGTQKDEVVELKKYYSLLQVKDYLLSQEVSEKCDIEVESIVYFYEQGCSECIKQGYVLTELKRKYPWLRIYSFDRNLDFAIVTTFAGLYDISENPPVIVIGDEKHSGFKTVEEIEEYIPELEIKKELEDKKQNALEFLSERDEFSEIDEFEFVSFINNKMTFSYDMFDENGNNFKEMILLYYTEKTDEFLLNS